MPSFATTTEVRDGTDDVLLSLRARHILVAGSPSANTHTVKGRLPDDVDVVLESDLVLSLSGMHNRARIGSRDVQRSAIANHLLNYFHVILILTQLRTPLHRMHSCQLLLRWIAQSRDSLSLILSGATL
ncbi:hypothetical protein BD413DRAFT_152961 [Trametes elegans]|nr:hypothetical protein BD413DRAFT_152961 [Trametes elegans]